jgi:hypothetical protein
MIANQKFTFQLASNIAVDTAPRDAIAPTDKSNSPEIISKLCPIRIIPVKTTDNKRVRKLAGVRKLLLWEPKKTRARTKTSKRAISGGRLIPVRFCLLPKVAFTGDMHIPALFEHILFSNS